MIRCAHCRTSTETPQTLCDGKTACSPSCALALIFQRVEVMSQGQAEQRFRELYSRGGLYEELADEMRFLAARLGVALVWERIEL